MCDFILLGDMEDILIIYFLCIGRVDLIYFDFFLVLFIFFDMVGFLRIDDFMVLIFLNIRDYFVCVFLEMENLVLVMKEDWVLYVFVL